MTRHDVKIDPRWFERIRLNEMHAEIRFAGDRDYQTGDTIRFWRNDTEREYVYSTERKITHVLRNVAGLDDNYVILSLADPRVEDYQQRWNNALAREDRQEHRIRGLRGQITRLRNQAASA
jgi:hypothetical protein